MNVLKKAFPFILIVVVQLIILALLNLGLDQQYIFPEGTIANDINFINVLLVILSVFSILLIGKTINNIEQEIENQIRLENLVYLNELFFTMRGQRHDLNNHLQTLYGFLSVEAYEEAKVYLDECISKVNVINQIIRSDNSALNAMLYVKSAQMERYGILFEVDIRASLCRPVKTIELNVVVGNLLDNAIQKLTNTPSVEDPKIVLESYIKNETVVIKIIDNGSMIEPSNVDKIFVPGFSTKQGNEGMGLYTVRKLLDKYNGTINVISKMGLTTFTATLPLKKDVV